MLASKVVCKCILCTNELLLCYASPAACRLGSVKEKRAIMNLYNRENDPLDDEEELR